MCRKFLFLISLVCVLAMVGSALADDPAPEQEGLAPAVPTVSQWGLIIMALVLLTAGATVIIWRKRRAAA